MKKPLLALAIFTALLPWPVQAATKPTDMITIINEDIPAYRNATGPATTMKYTKQYKDLILGPKEKDGLKRLQRFWKPKAMVITVWHFYQS